MSENGLGFNRQKTLALFGVVWAVSFLLPVVGFGLKINDHIDGRIELKLSVESQLRTERWRGLEDRLTHIRTRLDQNTETLQINTRTLIELSAYLRARAEMPGK